MWNRYSVVFDLARSCMMLAPLTLQAGAAKNIAAMDPTNTYELCKLFTNPFRSGGVTLFRSKSEGGEKDIRTVWSVFVKIIHN